MTTRAALLLGPLLVLGCGSSTGDGDGGIGMDAGLARDASSEDAAGDDAGDDATVDEDAGDVDGDPDAGEAVDASDALDAGEDAGDSGREDAGDELQSCLVQHPDSPALQALAAALAGS